LLSAVQELLTNLNGVRKGTLNINSEQTGVYAILCKFNEFSYIGSASGKGGFCQRMRLHLSQLRKGKHHSLVLQRHFNKYGEASFIAGIVEICSPEECLKIEQKWLDLMGVGYSNKSYNTNPMAHSCLGVKRSEETRRKSSLSKKGLKYPPRPPMSEEAKANLRAINSKRYYRIYSPMGEEFIVKNLLTFCKNNHLESSCMYLIAKGLQESHKGGWKCRYFEETEEEYLAKLKVNISNRIRKKQFILITPENQVEKIENLRAFCKKRGLNYSSMIAVANGLSHEHQGWYCYHAVETEEQKQRRIALKDRKISFVVTDPSGEETTVENLREFCEKRNLHQNNMRLVARGKQNSHKGYKCRYTSEAESERVLRLPEKKDCRKDYVVTVLETQEEILIHGLTEFCQARGLTISQMSAVANGDRLSYRGYICRHASESEEQRRERIAPRFKNKKEYIITNIQTGEETRIRGLRDYCRQHDLIDSEMSGTITGRIAHHRGYRVRYADQP